MTSRTLQASKEAGESLGCQGQGHPPRSLGCRPNPPCPVARVAQPKSLKPPWALFPSSLDRVEHGPPPSCTVAYRLVSTPTPAPEGYLPPSDTGGNTVGRSPGRGPQSRNKARPWVCWVTKPRGARDRRGGVSLQCPLSVVKWQTQGRLGEVGGERSGWWGAGNFPNEPSAGRDH